MLLPQAASPPNKSSICCTQKFNNQAQYVQSQGILGMQVLFKQLDKIILYLEFWQKYDKYKYANLDHNMALQQLAPYFWAGLEKSC